MIKLLVPVAAIVLIACSAAPDVARADDRATDEPIRIAAWNIEHLAAEPGQGCEPRDEAGYQLVASIIEHVDADIWLLQEVENETALAHVFDPDSWTFHVEGRPNTGTGPVCRGRDDGNRLRMQRTAIVVRSDLDHVRGEDLTALDVNDRGFLRHGVTITIDRSGTPLDLMSVHLKSGCFSGDRSDDCPTLFEQIPVLEAWADDRSNAGHAVLIGGDFNRRLEQEGDRVWSDLDDNDPVDWIIAGEGVGPRCDPRYREFIDFLIMNEDAAAMAIGESFRETTFEEDARASDHCPISVTLR